MRSKKEVKIVSLIGKRDKFVKMKTTLNKKIYNILSLNSIES
jgi:hypothetical protein